MEVLTTETFKAKIFNFEKNKTWVFEGDKPAIVDFYADWCGPCRALAPILEEVAVEYADKIDVYKIDTDASPELAALFEVRGIPALLFASKNSEPAMASGVMPKDSFKRAIKELFGLE